jgi:ATP-dependent helicase HrpB
LTRLETVRISRASADQRRGRAGRTGPGLCYRLWPQHDDAQLAPRNVPEILDADLTPLALELAAAAISDAAALTWLDAPPAGALAQGRALLQQLGALDGTTITPHGRAMAAQPVHPRLAHLLLRGRQLGHGALACDLAALLSNRDVISNARGAAAPDATIAARLEAVRDTGHRARGASTADDPGHRGRDASAERDAVRRVRQDAAVLRERLGIPRGERSDHGAAGLLLSFAYPDRIARRRGAHGRFVLANGTGAHFAEAQPLGSEEWIVIAETDGRVPESRIYLAAPVALADLREHHAGAFSVVEEVRWNDAVSRVVASRVTRLGEIVVHEESLRDVDPSLVRSALVAALRAGGVDALPWSDAARQLRQRLAFARTLDASWPDVSDRALLDGLETWLGPALADARSPREVRRADLSEALLSRLDWKQRAQLDAVAPAQIELPGGAHAAVDYSDPTAPALHVRLQDLYGVRTTPSIAQGRVPLTLHLLSPARRPVQVTRDLAAFWKGSYADVRKDMRGRYPKHDWPVDPANASPPRKRR